MANGAKTWLAIRLMTGSEAIEERSRLEPEKNIEMLLPGLIGQQISGPAVGRLPEEEEKANADALMKVNV